MKYLVFDHSVVSYIGWTRMHATNYEAQTDSEIIEFARNFAEIMCYTHTLIQPDRCFLLLDCPGEECWRHKIYEDYYKYKFEIFERVGEFGDMGYYITVDGVYHLFYWNEELSRYTAKKLKKSEVGELGQDETWWRVPLNKCNEDAIGPITEMIPGYKKGRKVGRWDYDTTKIEFKERARKLAPNFAPLIDGVAIGVDNAEADDLAYAFCRWMDMQEGDNEVIFVTTDSDWQQLAISRDNVSFYNPATHAYVDKTQNQMQEDFWVKLIGGDRSDSIPGVMLENGTTKIGDKRAATLVEQTGLAGMPEFIKSKIDHESYQRNLDLISLKRIPYEIVKKAYSRIDKAVFNDPKYGWDAFHFDDAIHNLTVSAAQRDRVKLDQMVLDGGS